MVVTTREALAEKRARRARLVTLLSYLRGSASVFQVQIEIRDRLHERLIAREPQWNHADLSIEAVFRRAYPTLSEEEKELHDVIRGYTSGGLRPLNEAMLQWLEQDMDYKLGGIKDLARRELAEKLTKLEEHLLLWRAKYKAWIPDRPVHALVYLADEERHGVGFPEGIEETIERVLA